MSAGFWWDGTELCSVRRNEHYRSASGWLQQSHSQGLLQVLARTRSRQHSNNGQLSCHFCKSLS